MNSKELNTLIQPVGSATANHGWCCSNTKADVDSKFTAFNSHFQLIRQGSRRHRGGYLAANDYTNEQLRLCEVVTNRGGFTNQIDGNITVVYACSDNCQRPGNRAANGVKNQHIGDLFTSITIRLKKTDSAVGQARHGTYQRYADNKSPCDAAEAKTPPTVSAGLCNADNARIGDMVEIRGFTLQLPRLLGLQAVMLLDWEKG